MVIRVLDHVANCYTWQEGAVIGDLIRKDLEKGQHVAVSFSGVKDVPSSFVNAAFIVLLDRFEFAFIRKNLAVVDSTRQINDMIKRRFEMEATGSYAIRYRTA